MNAVRENKSFSPQAAFDRGFHHSNRKQTKTACLWVNIEGRWQGGDNTLDRRELAGAYHTWPSNKQGESVWSVTSQDNSRTRLDGSLNSTLGSAQKEPVYGAAVASTGKKTTMHCTGSLSVGFLTGPPASGWLTVLPKVTVFLGITRLQVVSGNYTKSHFPFYNQI